MVARRESGSAPVVLSPCLRVYRSDVLFSSYSPCLADEWSFLSDPDPPHVCVTLMEGPVEVGQGEDVGQTCVRRRFSSGSPSPPRARPGPAFHSNLMIMIFAQDDLCLHSVITPPSFL